MQKMTKAIIAISVTLIVIIGISFYISWLNQTDYWYSAPDGRYLVFVSGKIEGGQIFFPLCEHSGGDLHGYWKIADGITYPTSIKWISEDFPCGYAWATLQNNLVTKIEPASV